MAMAMDAAEWHTAAIYRVEHTPGTPGTPPIEIGPIAFVTWFGSAARLQRELAANARAGIEYRLREFKYSRVGELILN